MPRRAIAGLIVVGLGVGIWMLWPRGDQAGSTTTAPLAVGTTSTTAAPQPTTTSTPATTTTSEGAHVVETVEEAEEILRELWFGWFEGIYNQDEDRIREVVATEEFVEAAIAQFGVMDFAAEPTPDGLTFSDTEILLSNAHCLAAWTTGDADFLDPPAANTGVDVLRRIDGDWMVLSTWQYKDDLWEDDCSSSLS